MPSPQEKSMHLDMEGRSKKLYSVLAALPSIMEKLDVSTTPPDIPRKPPAHILHRGSGWLFNRDSDVVGLSVEIPSPLWVIGSGVFAVNDCRPNLHWASAQQHYGRVPGPNLWKGVVADRAAGAYMLSVVCTRTGKEDIREVLAHPMPHVLQYTRLEPVSPGHFMSEGSLDGLQQDMASFESRIVKVAA